MLVLNSVYTSGHFFLVPWDISQVINQKYPTQCNANILFHFHTNNTADTSSVWLPFVLLLFGLFPFGLSVLPPIPHTILGDVWRIYLCSGKQRDLPWWWLTKKVVLFLDNFFRGAHNTSSSSSATIYFSPTLPILTMMTIGEKAPSLFMVTSGHKEWKKISAELLILLFALITFNNLCHNSQLPNTRHH